MSADNATSRQAGDYREDHATPHIDTRRECRGCGRSVSPRSLRVGGRNECVWCTEANDE